MEADSKIWLICPDLSRDGQFHFCILSWHRTPGSAFPNSVQSLVDEAACVSLSSVRFSLAITLLPPRCVNTPRVWQRCLLCTRVSSFGFS